MKGFNLRSSDNPEDFLYIAMVSHENIVQIIGQCEHILSQFKTFSHFHSPPLLLLTLHVTIKKESISSNFSNVRSTKFKEGRKEAITPFGVFHALAVISTAHFLKTHVCTIYGEKQVRLAAINPTFQFKSLWEEFQLRTGCRDFLLV